MTEDEISTKKLEKGKTRTKEKKYNKERVLRMLRDNSSIVLRKKMHKKLNKSKALKWAERFDIWNVEIAKQKIVKFVFCYQKHTE